MIDDMRKRLDEIQKEQDKQFRRDNKIDPVDIDINQSGNRDLNFGSFDTKDKEVLKEQLEKKATMELDSAGLQNLNTSLLPSTNNIYSVGSSGRAFAGGYFSNLYFNSTSYLSGVVPGEIGIQGHLTPITSNSLNIGSASSNFEDVRINGKIYCKNVQVLSSQQSAITNPTGGATIDTEARTTIGSILTTLRNHGLIAT